MNKSIYFKEGTSRQLKSILRKYLERNRYYYTLDRVCLEIRTAVFPLNSAPAVLQDLHPRCAILWFAREQKKR